MDNSGHAGSQRLAALYNELRPGETVLWYSIQHPRLLGSFVGIWAFAIPWTSFALLWMSMAFWITRSADHLNDPGAQFFPLYGLPFVLIGLGMLSLPILRFAAARRTIFAVTNQRIIRLLKGRGIIMEWVPARRISKVIKNKRKAPHGTVTVTLKGKAADFEPKGKRFIMADVEQAEIAKRHIQQLAASEQS